MRLTALPDIYFKTDTSYDSQKQKGSYAQLQALSAIAILIVLIAVINFMNFSNALVPVRLRVSIREGIRESGIGAPDGRGLGGGGNVPVVLPDRFAAGSPVVEDRVCGFGQWRHFLGGADALV